MPEPPRLHTLQSRSDLRGFESLMQRRSNCLFEGDLAGEKLVRRLQITYARGVLALQHERERHEINLTRLIRGQRDAKILLRQRNQRVAIENRALVSELRGAEQDRNRGRGLYPYQRKIRPRCLQIGLRARNVLILLEPEKNRQVEPDDSAPVALLTRPR